MKRILLAFAVLAVSAITSFAADTQDSSIPGTNMTPADTSVTRPDMNTGAPQDVDMNQTGVSGMAPGSEVKRPEGMRQAIRQHPEMRREMMHNPQHLLMMAYHKNLMVFGRALDKVAHQGDTVPREFARTCVAEMRRSTDEMEKYRAEGMPAEMKKNAEMQKMMTEHLVKVKSHLRDLEELVKNDRIPSQEVSKHLQAIFEGCEGMDCGLTQGRMHHDRGMHCCCECDNMMPERRHMMEGVMKKMQAQDAELTRQVQAMNSAPMDDKLKMVTDVVTKMVQQRVEMTQNMEKMQKQMMKKRMRHYEAVSSQPGAACEDEDAEEDCTEDGPAMDDDMDMHHHMEMHDNDQVR